MNTTDAKHAMVWLRNTYNTYVASNPTAAPFPGYFDNIVYQLRHLGQDKGPLYGLLHWICTQMPSPDIRRLFGVFFAYHMLEFPAYRAVFKRQYAQQWIAYVTKLQSIHSEFSCDDLTNFVLLCVHIHKENSSMNMLHVPFIERFKERPILASRKRGTIDDDMNDESGMAVEEDIVMQNTRKRRVGGRRSRYKRKKGSRKRLHKQSLKRR